MFAGGERQGVEKWKIGGLEAVAGQKQAKNARKWQKSGIYGHFQAKNVSKWPEGGGIDCEWARMSASGDLCA